MFVELEGVAVAHAVRNDTGAYDVTIIAYRIDTTPRWRSPASAVHRRPRHEASMRSWSPTNVIEITVMVQAPR